MTTISTKPTQESHRAAVERVAHWIHDNPPPYPLACDPAALDSFVTCAKAGLFYCNLQVGKPDRAQFNVRLSTQFCTLNFCVNWSSWGMTDLEGAKRFAGDMVLLLDWLERCKADALGTRARWDAFDPRV